METIYMEMTYSRTAAHTHPVQCVVKNKITKIFMKLFIKAIHSIQEVVVTPTYVVIMRSGYLDKSSYLISLQQLIINLQVI